MTDQPTITFAYPRREHEALADAMETVALRVLRSGSYILGTEVDRFEAKFRDFTGSPYAVALSSGSDALLCALMALGVEPCNEVLVPAFGFVAAAEAVLRLGARPVFVDIEPHTLGPDPTACASARTSQTRAVIVMHLFGQAVDLDPLRNAVPQLPIIEDAAQALGTRLHEQQVGTIGTIGTYSFFPAKSLGAAGDAGAVTTSDPTLAHRIQKARVHGASRAYEWDFAGGNYRMDAIQAALLAVKIGALDQRLKRRREIGVSLTNLLASHGVEVFLGAKGCEPTYAPLVLRTSSRDHALHGLRQRGIDARVHYPRTLPGSKVFHALSGSGHFPIAEQATRELLSLPSSPEMREEEVGRLLRAVDEVFRG